MNEVDRLKYQTAFRTVSYLIQKERTSFDKVFMIRINNTKGFFGNVIKGLESRINPNKGYHIVEDLKEIVEVNDGRWKNASTEDIEYMVIKFKGVERNLEKWLKNPKVFYEENPKEAKELSVVCNKLKELYRKLSGLKNDVFFYS